jgi:hypothetical protein
MAETDWVTRAEAKAVVGRGLQDDTKNALLDRTVSAVSRRLDRLVGPVVRRAVTDEEIETHCFRSVEVSKPPVSSFASVFEYTRVGATSTALVQQTPGVWPQDGYYAPRYRPDPALYSGELRRTWQGYGRYFEDLVVVTYTAGRVDSTAAVGEEFKEAALVTIKNWWRQHEQQVATMGGGEFELPQRNFPTFAVPRAARQLLKPYLLPETGFGG